MINPWLLAGHFTQVIQMNSNSKSAPNGAKSEKSKVTQTAIVMGANKPRFKPRDSLQLIAAHKLVKFKISPRKNHWGILIQSNQTGMIFGPRGHGKTWFSLGLAIGMSSGVKFLSHGPGRLRRVIYLDGEMDLANIQQRIKDLCMSLSVEPPPGLRLFTPEAFTDLLPSINTPEGQRAIDEMIKTDWDVMFIDNYSAWSGDGRENAEAWAPMMRWMLGHKRAGRTVIVVHHTGKTGKQRGSSSHEDALDWSIALKPVEDKAQDGALRFNLVWEKARHLPSDETQPIAVCMKKGRTGPLEWDFQAGLHKDPKVEQARALKAQGLTLTDIALRLGVDRTTVGRWNKTE
jgi:hypothetical protein